MRAIISLLLLLCTSSAYGQIRGRIIDVRSQESLPGAIVSLHDSAGNRLALVTTRSTGEFQLREQPTAFSLRIRLLGYVDTQLSLPISSVIALRPTTQGGSDVTVTANRVATAVQDLAVSTVVAKSAEIQSRSPQGLDNILRAIPGVTVTESQVSIRGSSGYARAVGSRVLLLLDGMPFLSGDNGDMKFDAIPFPAVDRVEVIKGAGSALYGSNAIGGVVNVLTRDPRDRWRGGVAVTAGQYDDPKYAEWKNASNSGRFYNLDAGVENRWEDVGALITASYRRNEGYRFGDDVERYNIFAKAIAIPSAVLTLRASSLYANDEHGGWLFWRSLRQPYMDADSLTALIGRTRSNRLNLHLGSDYAFGDALWVSKASYYTTEYVTDGVPEQQEAGSRSRANTLSLESFVNLELGTREDQRRANRGLAGDPIFGWITPTSGNMTLGINANHYGVNSTTLSDQTAIGAAAFGQFEIKTLEELTFLPGVRFDLYKANNVDEETRLSPKIGINYRPTEAVSLRTSYGTGFRVPTLTERFINSRMAGFTIIPNDSLRPERSTSAEFGAMYRDEYLTVDAAVFGSDYEEMIEPMFVGDKIQFRNITRARQQGHEEFIEVRPFASELLKARAGYTYVYSEDLDSKTVLPYRPRHLVLSRAEWNPPGFGLSADFRYLSAYETTDSTLSRIVADGDVRNAAYVVDARATIELKPVLDVPVKLTFQVQNLLNYYYVEIVGNMGPLRNYSLKLETTL